MTQMADFADKLGEIMPTIMKEFARCVVHDFESKISLPQRFIMEFLDRNQGSKMKDLARFMNVTTAAATGIIERLVRDGYVVRVFDPNDRRIIRVRLTSKGSELVKRFDRQRRLTVIRVFGKISEKDREDYLRILGQIKDALLNAKAEE